MTLEIGYILKGYPRISETFIINEIYLLEQMGVKLNIFSVKQPGEKKSHAIVDSIKAPVTYLPEVTSVTDSKFSVWLWVNLPKFFDSHFHLFRRRPKAYIQTLAQAFHFSLKYRRGFWPKFKKVFFKDFLRAGHMALKVLKHGNIGHLHGHFCHGSTTITMFVSQLTGIPYSFTGHAKDIYLPKLNPGDLLSIKIQNAEFVATCTDANRQHLEQLRPNDTPIRTIYHGLDTSRFIPEDDQIRDPQQPVILSVGRHVEKKGFPYLIKACRLLKDRKIDFQCRIIGEAEEQTDVITQLVKDLQLEGIVIFQDAVTQDELREIYHGSTLFALACHIVKNGDRDGIPNVLVEAMASGIPVVSTDISGIPELVEHGVNGLLVSQRDEVAMADALETLLADSDQCNRLGEAGREKVCRLFDSQRTTVTLKSLFGECLGEFEDQAETEEVSRHSPNRKRHTTKA